MELIARPSNVEPLATWRLGPLAYAPTALWRYWLVAAAVVALVHVFDRPWGFHALVLAVGVGLFAFAYRVVFNETVVLYMDDSGIWISQGILPWRRGVHGVYWRDIESIVFDQNLTNWLTQSYPVRIIQRFTDRDEVRINHVWRGHKAVTTMNHKLMEITRAQPIGEATDAVQAAGRKQAR